RAAPASVGEVVGGERVRQRLGTEVCEQRMTLWLVREVHDAESPRFEVTQARAVGEADIEMVVLPRRRRARLVEAQAAGHPEMHEQRPGIRAEQQVLRAARDRVDALTGEDGGQLRRNRPAQARLADLERLDAAADDERRKTAAGRFDFGELRHRMAQLTLPRRRSLPSPVARRSW